MTDYLIRPEIESGENAIYQAGSGELDLLSFSLLRLGAGEDYQTQTGATEVGLIILSGLVTLNLDGQEYPDFGGRTSVFSGKAAGAYLPPDSSLNLQASTEAQVAICSAPSESEGPAQVITADQVQINDVGHWNWRRQVHNIIGANVPQAQRLLIGETFNSPGNWSGYPPHKHEEDDYPFEVNMEEIYYFRVNPPQGFGIQRIYTDDRSLDVTYAVENEDVVLLPRGYHPVAAAPGYQLYYLWMMAGAHDRRMAPRDDPQHTWVKVAGNMARDMGF